MKKIVTIIAACFALYFNGYSQCTPHSPTGTPGLTPPPDSVTCIQRSVYYDFTLYFENFNSFNCSGFTADVTSSSIDNITNFPCGISWQADQSSYGPGETGCIRITGTSTDAVGQYPLTVYMTVNLDISGFPYTVSGSIQQLQDQLQQFNCSSPAVDANYYARVINPATVCPPIDRSGSANNLTASATPCPAISVSISGNTAICNGSSTILTANVTDSTGVVTYSWSPGGSSTKSINVSPTATTPYSVTATDQNGSATALATVTVNQKPNASFTTSVLGLTAAINNTTTGATSFAWNFGDTQTSAVQNPPAHTYSSFGTYTIRLIATNNCGADTATQDVNVGAVGISSGTDLSTEIKIYPNPFKVAATVEIGNVNGTFDFAMYSIAGLKVYEQTGLNEPTFTLQRESLPQGVYFIEIRTEKALARNKVIVY